MDNLVFTKKGIGKLGNYVVVVNFWNKISDAGQCRYTAQLKLVKLTIKIGFVDVGLLLAITNFVMVMAENVRKLNRRRQ